MGYFYVISIRILIIAYLLLTFSQNWGFGQRLVGYSGSDERVCSAKDIRNDVEELNALKGCTVVVGPLRILLFDNTSEADFKGYSFPELREVTDYILLYHVRGLTTLSNLFPNLAIIRGKSLLVNYALVIYEMPHLQDIGLKSLTRIERGSVRIERNYDLCYSDTVDWNQIMGRDEEHFVKDNGNRTTCSKMTCSEHCPGGYCWNKKTCQIIHREKNDSLNCHKECYGPCQPITKDCYICRHFTDDGVCVERCPKSKYWITNTTYCVTEEECLHIFSYQSWIFRGTCIKTCPKGFYQENVQNKTECIQCPNNKCTKVCSGIAVTNIDQAQSMRGCTYINGSLQIKLIGHQSKYIMKELEENLGDVEIIGGYLQIYRSLRITSLAFLKNLRVVEGNQLENEKSSLLVYEMPNLQNLWDWNYMANITLKRGGVFFHNNPKLCLNEIRKLINALNINVTSYDVIETTNGYKIGCQFEKMDTNSKVLGKHNATIIWDRFVPAKGTLLGYNIFYVESVDDDVTTEYGVDSCYNLGWNKKNVNEPGNSTNRRRLSLTVNDLESSTKYAYYVETIVKPDVNKNMSGDSIGLNAQSLVKYFTTKADTPPPPKIIQILSKTDTSITIYWINDLKYDSMITKYTITFHILEDHNETLDARDYCKYPIQVDYTNTYERPFTETRFESECDCQVGRIHGQSTLSYFRNSDFSSVICKKLQIDPYFGKHAEYKDCATTNENKKGTCPSHPEEFSLQDMYYIYSRTIDAPANNFTMKNLRPYGKYDIKLQACIGNGLRDCGAEISAVYRVQKNQESDDIMDILVMVFNNDVEIYWYPPDFPNGAVLAYYIQYSRTDLPNHMPINKCWTRKDHEANNFTLNLNLPDGIYKIRIKVMSLAGYGNYTDYDYFKVPVHIESNEDDIKTLLVIACFVVLITSTLVSYYYFRKKCTPLMDDEHALLNNTYIGARFTNSCGEGEITLLTESILDFDREDLIKSTNSKLVWNYNK